MAVWAALLNEPPPAVIDHAPVVALPPTLAPLNVIADGVADWQTVLGPPAVTVFVALTVTVAIPVLSAACAVQLASLNVATV